MTTVSDATRQPPFSQFDSSRSNSSFEEEPVTFLPKNSRGGLRRMVASLARLADLQFNIWATEAKIAMMRIAMLLVIFGAAMVLALLGIIGLFIGCFHLLTDVANIPPVWAYLIMGGFEVGCALVLFLIGRSMLHRGPATR